ncbi:hypothetical protein [Streptococcus oricebi]|uniref:Uncharacterized protein n=1 Tax=Streptococcus oricebi TaxID=1547447 RepID=A0ABS5B168_9STRE|nr:hypothetical protein [Streptococcus oricebi]MBP2622567.1 hypothetical protein [Streptococcus oricebi]
MKKKVSIIVLIVLVIAGGIGFMVYQSQGVGTILDAKGVKLYQHGFQLYEEQIATYIKENYSGVSKIEFSPIFVRGDGRYTMHTANIVPVLYDNNGNKAILGGTIGNRIYARYGLLHGISALDFDGADEEVIYLSDSATDQEIDVSKSKNLPKEAKITYDPEMDDNIEALVKDGQLKDVKKNKAGSPQVKVSYNIEIREGDYTKWRP